MQQAARTANSSEPPFPTGKLWSIGGLPGADRPQPRTQWAGDDDNQLPFPFNHSSFSLLGAQRATDRSATLDAAHDRHRVPSAEPLQCASGSLDIPELPAWLLRVLLASLQLEESETIKCTHSSPDIRWKERFRTKDCLEPLPLWGEPKGEAGSRSLETNISYLSLAEWEP